MLHSNSWPYIDALRKKEDEFFYELKCAVTLALNENGEAEGNVVELFEAFRLDTVGLTTIPVPTILNVDIFKSFTQEACQTQDEEPVE